MVQEVARKNGHQASRILEVLRSLQSPTNFLTEAALTRVAQELDVPIGHVYGVATFYSMYSTKPMGKRVIRFCESAPCHIKGAREVLGTIQEVLGIGVNETTDDGEFSLELTSCLGICAVAPAMMINSTVYGNLTPQTARDILTALRKEEC